jgi:hypothetical protein
MTKLNLRPFAVHQSMDDPLIQPRFWLSVGGGWGRRLAC